MGLDMYFYASSKSFKAQSRYDPEEETLNYPEKLSAFSNYIFNRNYRSVNSTESYQIGYFRKFNALHGYIVEQFANGKDECQPIVLRRQDAQCILDELTLISVDHSKAPYIMPVTSGFFFGSTEYNEYYFEDVTEAINFFTLVVSNFDFDTYDLVYQASW